MNNISKKLVFLVLFATLLSCEKKFSAIDNDIINCEECHEFKVLQDRGLPTIVSQVSNFDARQFKSDIEYLKTNINLEKFNWLNASYLKLVGEKKIYKIETSYSKNNENESLIAIETEIGVNYFHISKDYNYDGELNSGQINIFDLNRDENININFNLSDGFFLDDEYKSCSPSSVGKCISDNLNGAGGWELAGCIFLGKWCIAGLVALCTLCIIDGGCSSDIHCQ